MSVRPDEPVPPPSVFDLTVVRVEEDRVTIRAAGQLDLAARKALSQLLTAELDAGHAFVRMDLSEVSLVDSSCLNALKDAHDGCLASGGLLLLEGLCDDARQGLAAAGLDGCLFLAGNAGPREWLPNLPGLSRLVRHECVT